MVEELRAKYLGRVDLVVRHFPIPSHANPVNAAVAVEAASRPGRFEQMYQRMHETPCEWGERQESKAAIDDRRLGLRHGLRRSALLAR